MEHVDTDDLWQLPVQQSPLGMAKVGLDGTLLAVNRTFAEMLGRTADELVRCRFQDITHPDDLHNDVTNFRRTLAGELDSYRARKRYFHADGHVVWADLSVFLMHHPNGAPQHFVTQILDITEQQAREEQLEAAREEVERERQMLETVFETVGVGLLLIGPDGRYLRMNRRHVEAMKMAHPNGHDSIAGQPGHIYSADGRTQLAAEDLPSYRAMQGEEFDGYTNWTGSDERTRRAYSISARTVRGPSGERLGAAVAYQEVTELMRAIQVKDDFVASVSHELRTPLTSVLGYLEILADNGSLPQDVRAQVQVVRRNALRLQSLVSDLLEVGEFAETGVSLQRESVDIARIAREAAEAAGPLAERAAVELTADVPDWLVAWVDEDRVRQVLDNLLSNGVKYSAAGDAVRLVLRQVGQAIEIEIRDTGMGIADDDLPHVFDRFYRGAIARSEQIAGTGLGLDIVRTIVEAHGGSITCDSVLDQGTTFRVCLPVGT